MEQRNNTESPKACLEVPSLRGNTELQDTTEARLQDVRESMTFTRASKTIRRTGWYFTEPYAPCDEMEA